MPAIRIWMDHVRLCRSLLLVSLLVLHTEFVGATCGGCPFDVWGVSPRDGSLEGRTLVTLTGSGFAANGEGSNTVFLLINGEERLYCNNNWYLTNNENTIQCFTNPYPYRQESTSSPNLRIFVIVNGCECRTGYTFRYNRWLTPEVLQVRPSSVPPNSELLVGGVRFHLADDPDVRRVNLDNIQRVNIGNDFICELRNEENYQYGSFYSIGYDWIGCHIGDVLPGFYNASIEFVTTTSGANGATWNQSSSLVLGTDQKLSMIEIFPDIHEVIPNMGSILGGTFIEISGAGFGNNPNDVEVDVDGIPCEVHEISYTYITCKTGAAEVGHAAISDSMDAYPEVEDGYRFMGGRGVSVEQYFSIGGYDISDLYNSVKFPDSPDNYLILPSFEPEVNVPSDLYRYDLFGERYSAFFRPLFSGNQTFYLSSDDVAELYFSENKNINNVSKIAEVTSPNGWDLRNFYQWSNWRNRGDLQRSDMMDLSNGNSYLLVANFKEGGGADFLRVGVHYPDNQLRYNETKQAIREEQVYYFSTTHSYEIQTFSIQSKVQDFDINSMPNITLNWGGNATSPIPLIEFQDGDILKQRILDLFNATCTESQGNHFLSYSFEEGLDGWRAWGGTSPERVEYEQFCGHYSMKVNDNRALAFHLLSDGISVNSPYLCMAYKIPNGLQVNLRFLLDKNENTDGCSWYYMPFVNGLDPSSSSCTLSAFEADIVDDDRWHFVCSDIFETIENIIQTEFTIESFGFYGSKDPEGKSFFIDELSFSEQKRSIENQTPAARPNGMSLYDIDVTTNLRSWETVNNETLINITVQLVILPSLCDYEIPLIEISRQDSNVTMNVSRVQSASEPLGGNFTFSFNGYETAPIAYNAPTEEVANILERDIPGIEDIVSWQSLLSTDRVGRYCPGRRLTIRFNTLPGDQPFMGVDTTNLTGTAVVEPMYMFESWKGGLFVRPLPGYILQTVERTPQVHVKVKGHLAACGGNSPSQNRSDHCRFIYSPNHTPLVTMVIPTTIRKNDTVTVTGERFGDNSVVWFGEVECSVQVVSSTEITCVAGSGMAGRKQVMVRDEKGLANASSVVVDYSVGVDTVNPMSGGLGGGLLVTLAGSGFSSSTSCSGASAESMKIVVWIGSEECQIVSASSTHISCRTPAHPSSVAESVNVTVQVTCCDDSCSFEDVISDGFTYTNSMTTEVIAITPNMGSAGGGDLVTITGMNFLIMDRNVSVKIGSSTCNIVSINDTVIVCETSPHPPSSEPVQVDILDLGYALLPTGGLNYLFVLEVDNTSSCFGSLKGGQYIHIRGDGFGSSQSNVFVNLGDTPCAVTSVNATFVSCQVKSPAKTYYIDNNASHPEYGLFYKWSPNELTVHVGDTVQWSWSGIPYAQWNNVAQVPSATSVAYNGHGFRSEAAVVGEFSFTFHNPGTYYYISENYASIGMNGTIHVVDMEDISGDIKVTVNGISAKISDSFSCKNVVDSCPGSVPNGVYLFSSCHTPQILSITPAVAGVRDEIFLQIEGMSSNPNENIILIGGHLCGSSNGNITDADDIEGVITSSVASSPLDGSISCSLPQSLSPGIYWIEVYVQGIGYAYSVGNSSRITVTPFIAETSVNVGSLRGRTEIMLSGRGFNVDPMKNQIFVGNTPCIAQSIVLGSTTNDQLICRTLSALNDGYSSVVINDRVASYYSMQQHEYYLNGSYRRNTFPTYQGLVIAGQIGISGNDVTDQSALIEDGYLSIDDDSISSQLGFSVEFWARAASSSKSFEDTYGNNYHIILEHYSPAEYGNMGYVILVNPCNQIEVWLGTGTTGEPPSCNVTEGVANCSNPCSGVLQVSEDSGLPAGSWFTGAGPQWDVNTIDWTHFVITWSIADTVVAEEHLGLPSNELDYDLSTLGACNPNGEIYSCEGSLFIFANGQLIRKFDNVWYSDNAMGNLYIGGHPGTYSGQLAPFKGYLDEIGLYKHALTAEQVDQHYHYGTSGFQNVRLLTEGVIQKRPKEAVDLWSILEDEEEDYGLVTYSINWNSPESEEVNLNSNALLNFSWIGLHGVYQVNRQAYEHCDTKTEDKYIWMPGSLSGQVQISVSIGKTYYFIDSISENCQNGNKVKVTVGDVVRINWELGVDYEDIVIAEGTGLLFEWSSPFVHNLYQIRPVANIDVCSFINSEYGQSEKAWVGMPVTQGEVFVNNLPVGEHYFVCTVPTHCQKGMNIKVTVTSNETSSQDEDFYHFKPSTHNIFWTIQDYPPVTIYDQDSLLFYWHSFHSLRQVTETAYQSCDLSTTPLVEWTTPTVVGQVVVPHLTPGVYYFLCGVAGHCDAGMKLMVTVVPRPILSPLMSPIEATYTNEDERLQFSFSHEETPQITSVTAQDISNGKTITVTGSGIISDSYSVSGVTVLVGDMSCSNVGIVATSPNDIINCTLTNYEADYYYVDVHVDNKGLASVSSSSAPGPLRNASLPVSAYPSLLLQPKISSVDPPFGSLQGGTKVEVIGNGFSVISTRLQVTIGECTCNILHTTFSAITCRIECDQSNLPSNGAAAVAISINGYDVSGEYFTFSNMATPMVDQVVPPDNGSAISAGDVITINGQNLDGDTVSVKLVSIAAASFQSSSLLCEIIATSEAQINCTIPEAAAGSYEVVVLADDKGYSIESSASSAMIEYALEVSSFSPQFGGFGGGLPLTLYGSGFPAQYTESDFQIDLCGKVCTIISSSFASITCLTPEMELDINLECVITVSDNNLNQIELADPFQYLDTSTPQISHFTPNRGGTAGGTTLTIYGSRFLPDGVTSDALSEADLTVNVGGVLCDWINQAVTPNDSVIQCRTSEHRTTLQASVTVFVGGKGFAFTAQDSTFEYIDRWSSVFTWGGLDPPREGESVYIKSGQTVLLDIDTPKLNLIVIEGTLVFEDEHDIHLKAKYIFINGGTLQIGTEENPFMNKAVITLCGTVTDPEIPIYGAKVLGVRQGVLDLHGRPVNPTWTRLDETAVAGDTSIRLQVAVDWSEGDEIVIAPTGKDGNETEVRKISSVSVDGLTVHLDLPLNYTHQGITETFEDGQFIEIRAEVGLLTHNVVIQGDMSEGEEFGGKGSTMYGAQVLIHRAGPHPTPIRIENTEVRNVGQAFRLGRYALHFHLSASMNGSYVRNCAIHHSFNRALTIHGVHDVLIEGNVAYDIMGHTFFVEDGIETNNMYYNNLGVLTRGSSSLLNTDQIPATFWITNPQNIFIGNAAAASRAYGFWYDLDNHPSGPSFTYTVCPNKMPFGTFENNVAHTCSEFGLRIWETYVPYVDGCEATIRDVARLYNFTTYSNGIHGVELSVVGHVQLIGFKAADNRDNGIEIQETLGDWGGPLIKDALIISHTSVNTDSPGTGGIKTPNTRGLTISDVTFVNFDSVGTSCLRACSHCKVFQGGFQVWFNCIRFIGGSENNKVAFKWEHEVIYWDQDGTLSGEAGGWVVPDSSLHPSSSCNLSVPEFSVGSFGGAVCTSDVYFLRMAWNRAEPLATLQGVDVNVTNEFGSSVVPWRHYRLTHLDGYMFVYPMGYDHSIVWLLSIEHSVDTTSYNAGIYGLRATDYSPISHEFVVTPDHVNVGGNFKGLNGNPSSEDPNFSWFLDNSTEPEQVTYLINAVNLSSVSYKKKTCDVGLTDNVTRTDVTFSYRYEPCPRSGCPKPGDKTGPLDKNYRLWSNHSSWEDQEYPAEGADVVIYSKWRMLLDISPPSLGKVYIFGELKFADEMDLNFTADLIVVDNGILTVGSQEEPYQHKAIITLTGKRGQPDVSFSKTMNLGSKALGIFGNVSLIGAPVSVQWTYLASSALAGESDIELSGSTDQYVDWSVGDEIVIAPSGFDPEEAEIRTITDIIDGRIVLNEALRYNHIVRNMILPLHQQSLPEDAWFGDGGVLAPEIGLLTRRIVVQGGEDPTEPLEFNHFGCRVLIGTYTDDGNDFIGKAEIDSVEFRYCGQGGYFSPRDPRYSIAFKDLQELSMGNYITRSSIHHGYNTAIGIHRSNGILISDNVVYRTTDSSLKVGGTSNEISRNLAILTTTVQPNAPKDNHAVDFPATYDVDATNSLQGNVAAGSTRIGFKYPGEECIDGLLATKAESALFWDNTAHTSLIGLVVLGLPAECTAIGGLSVYSNWDYGVFSSVASRLVLSHSKLVIGKVGLNLNVFGPNPVAHLLGRKWVKVENTLLVGLAEDEGCVSSAPPHAVGGVSFSRKDHKLGVMMSSFNQKRSKMDGTGKWHLMKGYPVIDGRLELTNLTLIGFTQPASCSYNVFVIGNNPVSPDAVHPVEMRGTVKVDVPNDNIAHFYPPNEEWINQEDCIDMDCDGPKHALVRDVDGLLLDTSPLEGSVVPYAEIRFDHSRVPTVWQAFHSMLTGSTLGPYQVVDEMGVVRGRFLANDSCTWVESWLAYKCSTLQHHMFVIESMDGDTEVRRLSPLALTGGLNDTLTVISYTDLLNGPMDHGWCTYYTCLKRLSTFYSLVAEGGNYSIWMTGSNPNGLRLHLLNAAPDDSILVNIWYKNPLRKDVYKNGILVTPLNAKYTTNGAIFEESDDSYIPGLGDTSGTNYFDRNLQVLRIAVRGAEPIEIRTPPVIQVSLDLAVTDEEFFDQSALIYNLAFVLRIPVDSIRVVNVIAEDSQLGRRRRQIDNTNVTEIVIEIGSPPPDIIDILDTPTVADQYMEGNGNETVDEESDLEAGETNGNGLNDTSGPVVVSENPLNDDPPANDDAFNDEYNQEGDMYLESINEYNMRLEAYEEVTAIADDLAELVQTGNLVLDNVTLLGVTIELAPPPPAPEAPVIPPDYEDTVSNPVEEVEPYNPVRSGNGTGLSINIVVPRLVYLSVEPADVSSHLVYFEVKALDENGDVVQYLGITNPWECEVVIVQGETKEESILPTLGGRSTEPFLNGIAMFSRLRINEPSDDVILRLTTNPGGLTVVSRPFMVIAPPSNTNRERVHFRIIGPEYVAFSNTEEFALVLEASLAEVLDIDISRLDIISVLSGIYIELDILEPYSTDPLNVPTVSATIQALRKVADSGFSMIFKDEAFTILPGSFGTGPRNKVEFNPTTLVIGLCSAVGLTLLIVVITLLIFCICKSRKKKPKKNRIVSAEMTEKGKQYPEGCSNASYFEETGDFHTEDTSLSKLDEVEKCWNKEIPSLWFQDEEDLPEARPSLLTTVSETVIKDSGRRGKISPAPNVIQVAPFQPQEV